MILIIINIIKDPLSEFASIIRDDLGVYLLLSIDNRG